MNIKFGKVLKIKTMLFGVLLWVVDFFPTRVDMAALFSKAHMHTKI